MSWKAIKEGIKADALTMTKDNGYNYDWKVGKRADLDYSNKKAVFILETPPNLEFETNKTPSGGVTSFERKTTRRVNMIGRVLSDISGELAEDAIEANDGTLDLALEDIKKRFCGAIAPSPYCENGVTKIMYKRAFKRDIDSKGLYLPFELVVQYEFDYIEQAC